MSVVGGIGSGREGLEARPDAPAPLIGLALRETELVRYAPTARLCKHGIEHAAGGGGRRRWWWGGNRGNCHRCTQLLSVPATGKK